MKTRIGIIAILAASAVQSMPLGLRTAVWSVAADNGQNIRTEVEQLLPADCEESQLPETLAAFSDLLVVGNITNKAEYTEFREWALDSGVRADALAGSQMTWRSFALNVSGLVAEPEDGDLVIDGIALGADGQMEVVFSLAGANVGNAALETRLKAVFGVEGSASLDEGSFSDRNVGISLSPTGDGRIKATVTTPNSIGGSYFLRVKTK